jgi:hypothetical protein
MSSLNWLLDRDQLMAIAPKQVNDSHLKLTLSDLRALFWSAVGLIPASAALFGAGIWIRRKK